MAKLKSFNTHLDERYGKKGTEKRDLFEAKARAFAVGELIKEERKKAKLTQQKLAEKIGTDKSFISRVENGNVDVQLSTLYKIFDGMDKTLEFSISSK